MTRVFNNVSAITLAGYLFESLCWLALGSIASFVFISSFFKYDVQEPIFIFVCVVIFVFLLCGSPLFHIVCAIRFYLFEKRLTITIDKSTQQMQYITPTSKTILSLQHVAYWDVYFNDRMCSLEFNVLEFDNGQIIMFSNLFPLSKYLDKYQKEFGLPKSENMGTVFKYYKYLKFIREHETKNCQS